MKNKHPQKAVVESTVVSSSNSEVATNSNNLKLSYLTQSTEELTELILASENFEEVKIIISFMRIGLYRHEQVLKICNAFFKSNVLNGIEKNEVVKECLNQLFDGVIISTLDYILNTKQNSINNNTFFDNSFKEQQLTEVEFNEMFDEHFKNQDIYADESKNNYVKALQEGKTMDAPFYLAFLDYLIYQNDNINNF